MEKRTFYAIFALILILALLLRLNAINTTEPWWDENLYTVRPYNFLDSDHLSTIDQAPLYFYLSDVVYKILGLSILSSRFLSLIFGLFSIPLLYLLAREFSTPAHALLSSLFLAFSGFHIAYTIGDMGLTAGFFILLFFYFFIRLIKTNGKKYLILFCATLGITALVKSYALIFGFMCGLYLLYFLYREKKLNAEIFNIFPPKYIFASICIFLFFVSPILIYNFLLFGERGQMDIIFTRFFRLDESAYAGLGMPEFDIGVLPEHFATILPDYFFRHDPAIFSLGILGIALVLYSRKDSTQIFFALCFLLPLLFLLASTGLPKNFTVFAPLISFFAAEAALSINSAASRIVQFKYLLPLLALISLSINLYAINSNYEKSAPTLEMRDEASNYPAQTTLYIADSRIYNGKIAWALMDRHYLETVQLNYFPAPKDARNSALTKVVLIECAPGDCGWGGNKVDRSLMAAQIETLKGQLSMVREINHKGEPYYRIYSGFIPLEPYSLSALDYLHGFYFYPVAWKNKSLSWDSYKTDGNSLHLFGKIAIYISILAAIIISLYPIYLFPKSAKE